MKQEKLLQAFILTVLIFCYVPAMAQFEPVLEVSSLDGNNGFTIKGFESIPVINNFQIKSISHVGDINDDGIDDIIMGNPEGVTGERYAGISHVVYGKNSFNEYLDLSEINGSIGFTVNGIRSGSLSGYSVSNAGDVNGDGIDDVIIGGTIFDRDAPISYVVFGRVEGFPDNINLPEIDSSTGIVIKGVPVPSRRDRAYSLGALDINGDNISDVVLGLFNSVYVIFGSTDSFEEPIDVTELNGQNGFVIEDVSNRVRVSSAGDVNGDGIDDMVMSGKFNQKGEVYVVFGSNGGFSSAFDLLDLDGTNGFVIKINNDSGNAVSSAGDINADGTDDILIGSGYSTTENGLFTGASHIVYGSREGFSPSIDVFNLDGNNGFSILGLNPVDRFGESVSSLGDVNGDGISDFIIGAHKANSNALDAGSAYVIFGNSAGFQQPFDLLSLDGDNGFVVNGVNENDNLGIKVSSAGDINGDGIADILLSAYTELVTDPTGLGTDNNYVVFGKSNQPANNGFPIQTGHSALWYNPEQDGHGINVYMLEDSRLVIIWYVYDDQGNQVWLLGAGTHDGTKATLDVTFNDGAMFPPNFDTEDLNTTAWGQFEIEFSDCNSGLFKWLPIADNGYTAGAISVSRLTNSLGLNCTETGPKNSNNEKVIETENPSLHAGEFAMQAAHTALWYNPAQTGHGLNVYMLPDDRIIVVWYVYDDQGNQIWLLGVGTHDGAKATLDVNITSGAMFPPNFNAADVNSENWGQFEIEFSGCDAGLFAWLPAAGNGYSAGELEIARLINTSGLTCDE